MQWQVSIDDIDDSWYVFRNAIIKNISELPGVSIELLASKEFLNIIKSFSSSKELVRSIYLMLSIVKSEDPVLYTLKDVKFWFEGWSLSVSTLKNGNSIGDVSIDIFCGKEIDAVAIPPGTGSLGVSYTEIIPYLIESVKELTQAHRDLRAQITGSTDLGQLKASVSGSTFV